ncbi:MAG: sigma 54-interacting transcriptional regulator [Holophagales bacterium]|nr:MAG: sigma 54-interacting transcriptional regulator [Holophagales bacterium]
MDSDASLPEILVEIAEAAAETLELREVFDRVATAIRRLIPFDNMGVIRVLDDRWAVTHATTAPCGPCEPDCHEPQPIAAWSPRFRPRPGPIPRIDDAVRELDASFASDAAVLGAGMRSGLWQPFRLGESYGGVWLCSYAPRAFDDSHQESLRAIAALLGSAVEHWRLWDVDRRRRARLDRLDALMESFASSLDPREVLANISAAVREVLPHDLLVMTELDLRRRTLRIVASAGTADMPVPEGPISLSAAELDERTRESLILRDIPAEISGDNERERALLASGMRSWLRVPIWTGDEVRGGLGIFSRTAALYGEPDVEVAARLADRVGLVLSHQKLAEEARLVAEARERAERLEATVETLSRELEGRRRIRITGVSPGWHDVLVQIGRVASSETTVLITGESGTGKEIVADLIRQGSPRAAKPFVAVNCAALPEQLLESELFGHEKGAFTGAAQTKIGRLEQAQRGTLFLDEVGEMSPLVQAKFLRVLQEREFQRLGGTRVLKADVRVIAATNRDLAAAMARGSFREDLFYRLNVFEIHIPPLRERIEDVPILAESFLEELGRTTGRPAAGISRDAHEWLLSYHWPGNVRELRNAIERAILLCDGGLIAREHLPTPVARPDAARPSTGSATLDPQAPLPPGGVDLEEVERTLVERALRDARGNKSKAARLLGLTRAQLYSRLEKHGLSG